MTKNKVWFITGAGRGIGVNITKAALSAGHKVVATGHNTDSFAMAGLDVAEQMPAVFSFH